MLIRLQRMVALFALGALIGGPGIVPAVAQEDLAPSRRTAQEANATEPVIVVTLASLSKLQADVAYVSNTLGQPQYGGLFAGISGMYTSGIDPNQPVAVIVPLVNGTPEPIVMVPTADVQSLLKRVEAQIGPAESLGDGTLALLVGGSEIYVRQVGQWAVVARKRDLLSLAPADPAASFAQMGNNYDLAFRLNMQLVPPNVRTMLIDQLRTGLENAVSQSEDPEVQKNAERQIEQLETFIQETDELFFGLNIDPAGRQIAVDASFTAVDGSKMASVYAGQQSIPSRFSAVLRPDAAAMVHGATSISPELIEQSKESISGSVQMVGSALQQFDDLSDEDRADLSELIRRISEIAVDSISEGKSDAGAVLLAGDEGLQFVFGAFVSNGDDVAQLAKDIAAKVEGKPKAPRFDFDHGTYQGVTLHTIEADVPEEEDEARKIFGETIKVHIGTAAEAVYVALGDASMPLLKEMIDKGDRDDPAGRPITQGKLQMLPIVRYIQSIETNASIDAMIEALTAASDPGVVTFAVESIDNGQKSRIYIGEGVLNAIGAAIAAQQTGNGQF